MILDNSDDETDSVEWIKDTDKINDSKTLVEIFDCGCCDDCMCDYMTDCINCKCSCCSNIDDNDFDLEDDKKEIDYTILDFTIDVVESKDKERKVKIGLNLNLDLAKSAASFSVLKLLKSDDKLSNCSKASSP